MCFATDSQRHILRVRGAGSCKAVAEHSPPFSCPALSRCGGVAVILRGAIGADDSICYGVGDSVTRGGDGRPDKIET